MRHKTLNRATSARSGLSGRLSQGDDAKHRTLNTPNHTMPTIFDPFKINKLVLPNRIVRSATAERIAMRDEREGECLGEIYTDLASGGVGLIISGHIAVHPSGRLYPKMASIYTEGNYAAWLSAIQVAHKAGGTLFLQLNHGGGRCAKNAEGRPICVSSLPDRPHDAMGGDALTDATIGELVKAFAEAAKKARELGADGAQIHGAHGYLVSQFLSPLTNRRNDQWGGTLENRARFIRRVVQSARAKVGADFTLGIKLGFSDDDPAGLKIEESLQVAEWLATDGLDFIEISGGFRADICPRHVVPGKNEGYYLPFAARFKERLKIPVIAVGGLRSPVLMNAALASDQCDAIAMSRPLICQPNLPDVLRNGGQSECRGCTLCMFKNDSPTVCHAKR
jgi:2,4-dienoyl-CoA reductase-like NADH-dependent reductase (Old Yellow Enzyme family)